MTRRRSTSEERRAGYQEAREAFQTAERVRQARERLGVTQAELASRIGSTQPAIARLEAGGVPPSLVTLHRIAAALGVALVVELRARRAACGLDEPPDGDVDLRIFCKSTQGHRPVRDGTTRADTGRSVLIFRTLRHCEGRRNTHPGALENRQPARARGFESLPLRSPTLTRSMADGVEPPA